VKLAPGLTGILLGGLALSASPAYAGLFFARQSGDFVAGEEPMAVAAADIDADGNLDLAAANYGGDSVSVLWGIGDGTFIDSGVPFETGGGPAAVAVGDFNHDGKLDLATADDIDNTVSVLINQGNRSFSAFSFTDSGGFPQGMVAGNFNADEHTDVATANNADGTVTIFLGTGESATPLFIAQTVPVGSEPIGLTLADLNHDGLGDLVVANSSGGIEGYGSISVLKGLGGGIFEAQPEIALPASCGTLFCIPVAVAVGELNGDAQPDLVVANEEGDTVTLFFGNGDLTFPTTSSLDVGSFPKGVAVADFDRDGNADIATSGNFDDKVSVLLGDGTGSFVPAVDFVVGAGPVGVVAVDIDEDGKPDIVTANGDDSTVSVLINTLVGDCNDDNAVTVNELITLVNIAMQSEELSACAAGDQDGNGSITISEIITAVSNALE